MSSIQLFHVNSPRADTKIKLREGVKMKQTIYKKTVKWWKVAPNTGPRPVSFAELELKGSKIKEQATAPTKKGPGVR